jgi:putative ABC transport system ATP-binding protein
MRVELSAISKTYRLSETVKVPALRDVTLRLGDGELVALVGPSGCGKTTLLSILGLLTAPTSGSYRLDGQEVGEFSRREMARYRATSIGFIFQAYNLLPREPAWRNVMFPLTFRAETRATRRQRAMEALEAVGLAHRAHHHPAQMSGGEQQRVAVARALVNRPRFLLADEPTGNLDSKTGSDVLDLIIDLARRSGTSVVMATHDPRVASRAGRVVEMSDGAIVADRAGE